MDNPNIPNPHHQGGGPGAMPPPAQQQLPPQMFTTAAQLLDLTDKKLMVVLRDGRKLVGVLRSWDQFANIVLQSTTERIFATLHPEDDDAAPSTTTTAAAAAGSTPKPYGIYADVLHGMFLVRGENVLLLGEIDLDKDDDAPPGYELDTLERVRRLAERNRAREKGLRKRRAKKLMGLGFEGDDMGDAVVL